MNSYFLALYANMSFALGTMFFTHYARRFSSIWVNTFKATVAIICFGLAVLFTTGFHEISLVNFSLFFLSGFIALGIGDIFLVNAFAIIGPGRTMVLFGFHPLVVGVISFFAFDQSIDTYKFYAILFFVLCLFIFSYEGFKRDGHWEIRGLLLALLGMSLDAIGVTITRFAFDMNTKLSAFEGNFHRCFGAIIAYVILSKFIKLDFFHHIKSMKKRSVFYMLMGGFLGTFLSLAFYLEAIKSAHLASISAISITSVIFASLFESIWDRKLPSKYLYIAFVFFGFGMYFLLSH